LWILDDADIAVEIRLVEGANRSMGSRITQRSGSVSLDGSSCGASYIGIELNCDSYPRTNDMRWKFVNKLHFARRSQVLPQLWPRLQARSLDDLGELGSQIETRYLPMQSSLPAGA
jgi:hypothetical protein